jgi:hypothetical protein
MGDPPSLGSFGAASGSQQSRDREGDGNQRPKGSRKGRRCWIDDEWGSNSLEIEPLDAFALGRSRTLRDRVFNLYRFDTQACALGIAWPGLYIFHSYGVSVYGLADRSSCASC